MPGTSNRALAALAAATVAAGAGIAASAAAGDQHPGPVFEPIGTYASGIELGEDETSAETSAFERGRLYVTNSTGNTLDVVDASDPSAPTLLRRIPLDPWGAGPNSVDVRRGLVAVAVEADPKTDPGTVVFFDRDGDHVGEVAVGALPDMLTFTHDGRTLLVADEGEPTDYDGAPGSDPAGTVSIIDVTTVGSRRGAIVRTADFRAFDAGAPWHGRLPVGIRLDGPGASVAQDLEPEYITVSKNGKTAHVTLQEANAVAEIDVARARVTRIAALGWKDHSAPGAGLDGSNDDDAINIATRPVRGLYMPDAIAGFRVRGQYLITANEGDGRDDDSFSDETSVEDVDLDPTAFPGGLDQSLTDGAAIGPLTISATDGVGPSTGRHTAIYAYGARSATDWDADSGRRVWDSGNRIEQRVAAEVPAHFNANNTSNSFDNRSDNKGPEPEGVAVGEIRGRTYAFVGLERQGGPHGVRRQRSDGSRADAVGEQPRLRRRPRGARQRPRDRALRGRGGQPHAAAARDRLERGHRHGDLLRGALSG